MVRREEHQEGWGKCDGTPKDGLLGKQRERYKEGGGKDLTRDLLLSASYFSRSFSTSFLN